MTAEERDGEEFLLGEEAEVDWNVREQNRCIHIANVSGADDVAGVGIELFQADYLDAGASGAEEHASPDAGDGELLAAVGIKWGGEEANGAHDGGEQITPCIVEVAQITQPGYRVEATGGRSGPCGALQNQATGRCARTHTESQRNRRVKVA